MPTNPTYPTPEHAAAAGAVVEFFAARPETDAVLVVNSCARGKATPDSCLDALVLIPEGASTGETEAAWRAFRDAHPAFAALRAAGAFSVVHLDVHDGAFAPPDHPADEFPDGFELEIGNALVYSRLLWERAGRDRLAGLRARWLPYYDETLRRERLAAVRWCAEDCLDHVPSAVARGLYFQAFDRLYRAFQLFLQGLFVQRRVYPIAYNKWIREQVVEILGLPELYPQLPPLFEIARFESDAMIAKAAALRRLLDESVPG